MSGKTFSRNYLQGLPLERKRAEVVTLISSFLTSILRAAASGQKQYLFDMTEMTYDPSMDPPSNINVSKYYTIPIDEMVPLFLEKFPDCTITYQELMVDTKFNFKVPQKGILIDWS